MSEPIREAVATVPDLPSLPARLVQVFVAPGQLMAALKEHPRWVGALVLGALISLVATVSIPAEIWTEFFRQQMLEAGQPVPEGLNMGLIQKGAASFGVLVVWLVTVNLFAGVTTFVFAFVLGDQGGFRQHLAVTSHAMLIPAVATLLLVPLRISQRSIDMTLNLGLFTPFLDSGYLATFFRMVDLSQIWAFVVLALGVHLIDQRRSWGAAAMVTIGMFLSLAALLALVVPS